MINIFSIDVEDWFHLLEIDSETTKIKNWNNLQQRVEYSFLKLLDILDINNTKSTCFFLGWVAEKYPHLVREAYKRGHEIGVHGYYHNLVYKQTPEEFSIEISRTKKILENITGSSVNGYRAPGFSITKDSLWAYKILIEQNFKYSSSIFPSKRAHGYYDNFGSEPTIINYKGKEIIEFPMTSLKKGFNLFNCFGGGYFRLYPYYCFVLIEKFLKDSQYINFYIHPRDIDYGQPKLDLPINRYLKSYINIKYSEKKILKLILNYHFTSFNTKIDYIDKQTLKKLSLNNDIQISKYKFLECNKYTI